LVNGLKERKKISKISCSSIFPYFIDEKRDKQNKHFFTIKLKNSGQNVQKREIGWTLILFHNAANNHYQKN